MDRVPPRVLNPEPLPAPRRDALNSDTFWSLMDKWQVPPDRARTLIGYQGQPSRSARPNFRLTDEQGKVVSCLLEIDLTLAVAGLRGRRSHLPGLWPSVAAASPLDVLGRCDARRAGVMLWFLSQAVNRRRSRSRRVRMNDAMPRQREVTDGASPRAD